MIKQILTRTMAEGNGIRINKVEFNSDNLPSNNELANEFNAVNANWKSTVNYDTLKLIRGTMYHVYVEYKQLN